MQPGPERLVPNVPESWVENLRNKNKLALFRSNVDHPVETNFEQESKKKKRKQKK